MLKVPDIKVAAGKLNLRCRTSRWPPGLSTSGVHNRCSVNVAREARQTLRSRPNALPLTESIWRGVCRGGDVPQLREARAGGD
eukprot:1195655-Prorocentrum_minimum.AAC.3